MTNLFKFTRTVGAVEATVLAVAVVVGGVVFSHLTTQATPTTEVRGASTAIRSPQVDATTSSTEAAITADEPRPTVTAGAGDTVVVSPAQRSATAKVAGTTSPAAGKPANQTAASGSTSSTSPAPASSPSQTPVTPAPQPTFRIVLRMADATDLQSPFNPVIFQLAVPFDVIYDDGFEKVNYQQPGCVFLNTPVADHGALCDVNQKEADTGWFTVQYTDTTASGHYEVQMIYAINGVQRTAVYEFDLQ